MNKSVLYIIFLLFSLFGKAQENLVPNGSFEEYNTCPQNGEIFNANFFSSPTMSSPDYFNICALQSNNTSVPSNLGGYQEPRTGYGYAGIVTYGLGTNYKEYIQTSLKETLEYGKFYAIKFYISLGSYASVACNNIGFHFSQQILNINNNGTLYFNTTSSSTLIIDTLNWIELSFIYQAQGNENYLIIGNFKDDFETDTLNCNYGLGDNYYFIDDISVTEIEFQIPNVFSPNNDEVNDYWAFSFIPNTQIQIFNRWGNLIFKDYSLNGDIIWSGRTSSNQLCSDGIYYYILTQNDKNIKNGFISLIR